MLFEEQKLEEALTILEDFVEHTANLRLLAEAYFLQAQVLHSNQQLSQAAITLEQLIEEFPLSPLIQTARLMLAEISAHLDQFDRAITALKTVVEQSSDLITRQKALDRLRELYKKTGAYLEAVYATLEEMELVDEQQREELRHDIRRLVLQHLDERALGTIREQFPTSFPGGLALIRLIELHTAIGDEVVAEQDIRSFLRQFPLHPYAQTAMALLQSFMAKVKAHRHIIAAVFPFSGPLKPFGTDSLNGLRLALEEGKRVLGRQAVGLVVKDSATAPAQFRPQFSQILDKFQPLAVIGPLLAREVPLIADLAETAQVPMITPSATLSDIRQFGRFWFSTALTPSLQVEKIVEYAMGPLGFQRFCILYPRTASGRSFSRIFQKEVVKHGGEMVALESYQRGSTDLGPHIQRLKARDLDLYGQLTPLPLKDGETREVYVPGFDAVFLPGQPAEVAFIAAQLAFYDIKVPVLGSNGWNHPDILRWGKDTLDGGIFGAGLFLNSPDSQVQTFVRRYRERFHMPPSLFAVQAYDAMRLIIDTLRLGAASGPEVRDQLFIRHDLPALSGLTSFGEGGVLDRKVFLIQVSNRKLTQIN